MLASRNAVELHSLADDFDSFVSSLDVFEHKS